MKTVPRGPTTDGLLTAIREISSNIRATDPRSREFAISSFIASPNASNSAQDTAVKTVSIDGK
jgi:hypothetical protein